MKKKTAVLLAVLLLVIVFFSAGCTVNSEIKSEQKPGVEQETEPEKKPEPEQDIKTEEEKRLEEEARLTEERRLLEEKRKDELGEFYVPLPKIGQKTDNPKIDARGLYITGSTAGKPVDEGKVDKFIEYIDALKAGETEKLSEYSYILNEINTMERVIGIAAATEVNALVINVKNDSGIVTYESDIEIVKEIDSHTTYIRDTDEFMRLMDKYNIYTIARIVAFKDPYFSKKSPEHSIQLKSGGVWHDYSGTSWINPFDKYVWEYNIAVAKEAALKGFKEIQFDYVRFPDNAVGKNGYNEIVEFPGREGRDKDEAIGAFLKYAQESLKEYNVHQGADVFGLITRSWDDYPEDIGQSWIEKAPYVEYMCPMVYPSHYGPGWYGFSIPDAHPYGVLKGSMEEALEKKSLQKNSAEIRPWIQDFTATWVPGYIVYGPSEIRDQIKASKELGIYGYMVWNPSNKYNPEAFIPGEDEKNTKYPVHTGDRDYRQRTPSEAVKEYYRGEYNEKFLMTYMLTPVDERTEKFEDFEKQMKEDTYDLLDYEIYDYEMTDENNAEVRVMYKYEITKGEEKIIIEQPEEIIRTVREQGIWKIKRNINENVEVEEEKTSE